MNTLAPIVLFTYNRPHHTQKTLQALMQNELADKSVLYIYCDGAKEHATETDKTNITEVRKVVRSKQWCKEVHIIEAEKNKGLAKSIISAVTEIVGKYGKIIVLEDDIITSKGFLRYMNDALSIYQTQDKVMHVSAYMYPHKERLPETFFFEVPYPGGGGQHGKEHGLILKMMRQAIMRILIKISFGISLINMVENICKNS